MQNQTNIQSQINNPEETRPHAVSGQVWKRKTPLYEESKTQADVDDDLDPQSDFQRQSQQRRSLPRDQDVPSQPKKDVVIEVATQQQQAFIKSRSDAYAEVHAAFQNIRFSGGTTSEDVAIIENKFANANENQLLGEFQQKPLTTQGIDYLTLFTRKDAATFNTNCPITLADFTQAIRPVILAAQLQRHAATLSPERLAEATPYNDLAKLDIHLPSSVAEMIELLGQVNTNAGKLTIVGPKSGMRMIAAEAVRTARQIVAYQEDVIGLTVLDLATFQAQNWDSMRVVSTQMQDNRDIVSSLLKDLSLPRSVPVNITRVTLPDPNNPQAAVPPPLTLEYHAMTYYELSKNVTCQPIRQALDQQERIGSVTALKEARDNAVQLAQCGYDIGLETPDELLVTMIEKIVARWNGNIMPLNSLIDRRVVSKTGGGQAFQAIPHENGECFSKLVFSEKDYSTASLFPICYRDFVYIDKIRQQGSKSDKLLNDFVLQTIKK